VLGWVRDFAKPTGFIAGTRHLTIADLAFVASYSSILAGNQIDLTKYDPELKAWFERCKAAIPNYAEANGVGAEQWGQFLQEQTIRNKRG
jgi:glutathione S-transferase